MGRKFIKQVNNQNFIYPNNYLAEYDIELVQDINENSIYGALSFFSGTSTSSTGLTFDYTYVWEKNGAEPFISDNGRLNLVSVHMMAPPQKFYKPWRLVDYQYTTNTGSTTAVSGITFTVLPSEVGLTEFVNGTYYFEFRFIGHRMIYPICQTLEISTITPPPTPTPTGPPPTPTLPPPTVTPTPTPEPTGKSLQIYARDVADTRLSLTLFYSINGGGNINVPGATATLLPAICNPIYTITGLTTLDSVEFGTSSSYIMNGNGSSSSCPFSSGSATTFTYVIDAPTTQQVALTIDSGIIP